MHLKWRKIDRCFYTFEAIPADPFHAAPVPDTVSIRQLRCFQEPIKYAMIRAKPLSLNQLTWVIAITLSLLFAQFAGQYHRIKHTQWYGGASLHRQAQPQYDNYDNKSHSCLVFDAATLADTCGAVPSMALLLEGTHLLAQWIAFISWDAPVTHLFQSRAPPFFH